MTWNEKRRDEMKCGENDTKGNEMRWDERKWKKWNEMRWNERNKMKIELGVKRKAKAPNPLSCKKKSKIEQETFSADIKKTRRKRRSKSLGDLKEYDIS